MTDISKTDFISPLRPPKQEIEFSFTDFKKLIFNFNSFKDNKCEDDSVKGTFSRVMDLSNKDKPSEDKCNYETNIQKNGDTVNKTITDKTTGKVLLESNTEITQNGDITNVKTHIKRYYGKKVYENEAEFQYNKELLEDYVINKGTDKNGNIIKYFSEIPEIKNITPSDRTPEQEKLLKEFNDMINFAINSGIEYGVDPKLVIAIIQREVAFQGLSPKVVGENGNGYMQLTSAPIKDYLGYAGDKKYHEIKENIYGPEMEELLLSRDFEPKSAKTQEEREALYQKIYDYLHSNKDPEFNIRFGTLVLRRYLNKSKGNIKSAAIAYNGSSAKLAYGAAVEDYHNKINNSAGAISSFKYEERPLT